MKKVFCIMFLLLFSAGLCWGQTPLTQIWFDQLRVVPGFGDPTVLEDFEDGVLDWWDPDNSGSTYGTWEHENYTGNSTVFVHDTVNAHEGLGCARMEYQWESATPESAGFIREYAHTTSFPQTHQFTIYDKLEIWLYGNISGDMIRFCIDDSDGHEVSEWIHIDWEGWQLISWDLATDSVIDWVNGNGVLDGPNVDFDSFQIIQNVATSREDRSSEAKIPRQYSLSQNYPNPFNAETCIRFTIPEAGPISLMIYNVMGQLVKILVDEEMPIGSHLAIWNGTDEGGGQLASGIYFCRLVATDYTESIKMTFLR